MAVGIFVSIFVGLCLVALIVPAITHKRKKITYALLLIASILQLAIYHQGFRWDILGVLWRELLLIFFLISVWVGILRRTVREKVCRLFIALTLSLVASTVVVLTWLIPIAVSSAYPDNEVMDIVSPFPEGRYFVMQGGPYKFYNFNHQQVLAQQYAYDITRVETLLGVRGRKLVDNSLNDYYAMSTPLLSPCSGDVVYVVRVGKGESEKDKRIENIAGNSVVLECNEKVLAMAHLNSIFVESDTTVNVGMPIGTLGNTGRSFEPHLHIHAVSGPFKSIECTFFQCEGIPLRIENRLLLKNDVL